MRIQTTEDAIRARHVAAGGTYNVRVFHGGEERWCSESEWTKVADELVATHGPGVPSVTRHPVMGQGPAKVDVLVAPSTTPIERAVASLNARHAGGGMTFAVATEADIAKHEAAKAKPVSDWGRTHVDGEAKARIEAQHEALKASGVTVDTKKQFFATGTRMAQIGYNTQAQRKREHERKLDARAAADELRSEVEAEQRNDIVVRSSALAGEVRVNGKVTVLGYSLGDQAIRGMMARIDSCATRYLLGLRARNAEVLRLARAEERKLTDEEIARGVADRKRFAEVLEHELRQVNDTEIKLRVRGSSKDVFAAVSPTYAAADAPETIDRLLEHLSPDAKGTWAYDPTSTAWELRVDAWTSTPVEEQAVGEVFEGYSSFQSIDNGTGRLRGGGGVTLIRCLNASTYSAKGTEISRVHRSGVLSDFDQLVKVATASISAVCAAWGVAREHVVTLPSANEEGAPLSLDEAFGAGWRWLLTDRRSELAAILPGRTETHVKALSELYHEQRRDPARVVRADLCQAWTRYSQDQEPAVRREAELAAGAFLLSNRPVRFDLRA